MPSHAWCHLRRERARECRVHAVNLGNALLVVPLALFGVLVLLGCAAVVAVWSTAAVVVTLADWSLCVVAEKLA